MKNWLIRRLRRLNNFSLDEETLAKAAAVGASVGAVVSYFDGGAVVDATLLGGGLGVLSAVGMYLVVVLGP